MATSIGGRVVAGERTITTAGTQLALEAVNTSLVALTIIAKAGNTGQVFVGGSDVASTVNDGLDASESISFDVSSFGQGRSAIINTQDVFLDVSVNGEGVDFYGILAG